MKRNRVISFHIFEVNLPEFRKYILFSVHVLSQNPPFEKIHFGAFLSIFNSLKVLSPRSTTAILSNNIFLQIQQNLLYFLRIYWISRKKMIENCKYERPFTRIYSILSLDRSYPQNRPIHEAGIKKFIF